MKAAPSITEAESAVMETLWRRGQASAEEINEVLSREQNWQVATVKTLLNRLLKKNAIAASKDGRRYIYTPSLPREEWLSQQTKSLVDRLFGGELAPFVAHFSKSRRLTKKDVAELKRLIKDLDDGR
jgi:BlaI family penicillinase repressor